MLHEDKGKGLEVRNMCQYLSKNELEECCKDRKFCVVCLINRYDVEVEDHVCDECKNG